jgi:Glycosyl transferases group 1
MVGHFKAHKAYTRVVRILHALCKTLPKTHLFVIGSWSEKFGCSEESYLAFSALALRLGVLKHITCLGPLTDVDGYYPAFDAFLNSSSYEGVSLSTMQAIRAGCPVVSSDAGGQAEVVRGHGIVVAADAEPEAYAAALYRVHKRRKIQKSVPEGRTQTLAVPCLWPLLNEYGFDRSLRREKGEGVLFLTDNLNHGDPQRSLLNLLSALEMRPDDRLVLLEGTSSAEFHAQLQNLSCSWSSLPIGLETSLQANAILALLRAGDFETVCFWNADARLKMMLAKVLLNSNLYLYDFGTFGVAVLEARDGDAALADAAGRLETWIHGGLASPEGLLRSTNGSLRLSNTDQQKLMKLLHGQEGTRVEIREGHVSGRSIKDLDIDRDDPPAITRKTFRICFLLFVA